MVKDRVTLKEIAAEAGVHVSTASRALDPHTGHAVAPEAAERIRKIAARLGYTPNRIASGLRTRRTMTVGVMIPDLTNVIFPPMVRGVESVLEPRGYASIIVNTDSDTEREARLLGVLRERGVDGLLHAAVVSDDPAVAEAARSGLPIVTLNRKVTRPALPFVINDERAGVAMLVRHLVDLGHRRIAHVAGPQNLSTGQMRLDAFRKAVRDHALPEPEIALTDRFDEAEGERAASELMARAGGFTAVLAGNDRLALGALRRLRAVGRRCPQDVSVTGYNDMPFLDMIPPRLTTVRIRQFDAGAAAARLLLRLMRRETVETETVLPVELVVGESTTAPPADLRSAG